MEEADQPNDRRGDARDPQEEDDPDDGPGGHGEAAKADDRRGDGRDDPWGPGVILEAVP